MITLENIIPAPMIRNQAYTEAFRTGMRAACNRVTRDQVIAIAQTMPVREGDALLAGYYAEKRKLRADAQ